MAHDVIEERDSVHGYFGLTYANFAVYPRALLQSMPDDWQDKFVEVMREYHDHWRDLPDDFEPGYRVQATDSGGRLARWSSFRLPHYNRGRTRVERDGAIAGAGWRF